MRFSGKTASRWMSLWWRRNTVGKNILMIRCHSSSGRPCLDSTARSIAPPRAKGWGIFYNSAISSEGRINFTLGHEFGHYLIHRLAYPDGIRCGEQDVVRWD